MRAADSFHPAAQRLAAALTAVLALAILVLTLMPVGHIQGAGTWSDKTDHLLAFAALAFPLSLARPRRALLILAGAAALGGAIELIQPHVGRSGEWGDFLADVAGAALGAGAGWLGGRALERRFHRDEKGRARDRSRENA